MWWPHSLQDEVLVVISGNLERLSCRKTSRVAQFSSRYVSGEDPVLVGIQIVAVELSKSIELVEVETFAGVAALSTSE